jgi:riboflavin synthase
MVAGHIDGTGKIRQVTRDDNAILYEIEAPQNIIRYIIEKGSIAIDGISLTVTRLTDNSFEVSVIPHTVKSTVLGLCKAGDQVNLENDLVGKYIERLLLFSSTKKQSPESAGGLTMDFLTKAGF